MSSPPVSKHTPLPTSVTLGSNAAPHAMSIRRGARAEPRPTACTIGKFFASRSSPVTTFTDAPSFSAQPRTKLSSSAGPRSDAGVLMRSRPVPTASAIRLTASPSTPSGTTSRTDLAEGFER